MFIVRGHVYSCIIISHLETRLIISSDNYIDTGTNNVTSVTKPPCCNTTKENGVIRSLVTREILTL